MDRPTCTRSFAAAMYLSAKGYVPRVEVSRDDPSKVVYVFEPDAYAMLDEYYEVRNRLDVARIALGCTR